VTPIRDCIEHLIYEAYLSALVGSHLNATFIDPAIHMRTFVTRDLFDIALLEVKVEIAGSIFS
jgi:hypothetical protein